MAISPPRQPPRDAEDRFENLGAARSEQAADAEDLARPDIEAHALEHAPPAAAAHLVEREIAHRENGRAGAGYRIPASERHLPPDHRGNDRALRQALDRGGQHALAVAQHGHAIGESDDLVQAVRGVDDRDARLRELSHDLEQGLAFRRRERGGRLVHDQDPRVERQRLGDLDQLLLADPELRDATLRVDLDAEPLQQCARGLHDAPVVDEGPEDQRLAAKEDVLGRGQFGNQVEFLVDDRDAGALGVLNAGEANRRALDPDLAVIVDVHAGEDLHQGRLAGAVLAHEGVDLAAPQVEVDVAQSRHAGEGFGDAFGFEDDGVAVGRLAAIATRSPARSDARSHLVLDGNAVRRHAHHVSARHSQ